MQKTCPYSGKQFIPKRRDQVYASPLERMRYHNEVAAELRRVKAPIDKALEKNFLILSELLQEGDTKTFEKDNLKKKGYMLSYFTHLDNHLGAYVMCLYHFVIIKTENPNTITVSYPKLND